MGGEWWERERMGPCKWGEIYYFKILKFSACTKLLLLPPTYHHPTLHLPTYPPTPNHTPIHPIYPLTYPTTSCAWWALVWRTLLYTFQQSLIQQDLDVWMFPMQQDGCSQRLSIQLLAFSCILLLIKDRVNKTVQPNILYWIWPLSVRSRSRSRLHHYT